MTSTPDLLRLLVVPFFAWAAYTDVQTRRIPNRVWGPLFAAGVVLLGISIQSAYADASGFALTRELVGVAVSLGVVAPVAYLFWLFGGFGGADAKALLVLSLILPVYPAYDVAGVVLPLRQFHNPIGSFAFTILTNTVIVGVLFPATLFAKNALKREFSLPMVLGERVPTRTVEERYGTLMGSNDGMSSGSLDLDALRMYLTWRDVTLADVVENPDSLRDPTSLPADRNDPGGGEIPTDATDDSHSMASDGGDVAGDAPDGVEDAAGPDAAEDAGDGDAATTDGDDREASEEAGESSFEDPWGAAVFLEEIEGDAYGTTPSALRDGLDVLATEQAVWVSPGIPFIVPMFFGLVLALTVGDLTTAALQLL